MCCQSCWYSRMFVHLKNTSDYHSRLARSSRRNYLPSDSAIALQHRPQYKYQAYMVYSSAHTLTMRRHSPPNAVLTEVLDGSTSRKIVASLSPNKCVWKLWVDEAMRSGCRVFVAFRRPRWMMAIPPKQLPRIRCFSFRN